MTPDDVERLLASVRPVPLAATTRDQVLAAARQRSARRRDLWRLAGLAAAAALAWGVVLGAMRMPVAADPGTTALRALSAVPSFPGLPPALRQVVHEGAATPSSRAQPPPFAQPQPPSRFPLSRYEP